MFNGRFENKYALTDVLSDQVLACARTFLRPDRGIDGPQRVTSLYLETPQLTFYQWQSTRQIDRFKLRIRGYGEQPADCVYVEIKRKHGDLVRKQRAEVDINRLDATLGGLDTNNSPALDEFVKTHRDLDARPKILVSCYRTALRDTNVCGEIAVTVDREIVCQPVRDLSLVGDPNAWLPLPLPNGATTIVELKYVRQAPPWMADLIDGLAGHRVRFSKYGTAMEQYACLEPQHQLQATLK